VRGRIVKGGLNFEGRRQRPLFVSKSAVPYEHDDQVSLFQWLAATARLQSDPDVREALEWVHSIPNGAHLSKSQALKLVAEGLRKGVLDLSSDEPRQGYHGLRIEMKRKGRKATPEQLRYMAYLERIGVRQELCYTWTAAARVFVDYFSLTEYAPIPE